MISAFTAVTGLAGIGFGVSWAVKRKEEPTQSTKSSTGLKAADILNDSAFEASGQADAVVVDTVNAVRINHLLEKLAAINRNRSGAEEEIKILKAEVQKLLTTNRGGLDGIHGFLGETSQVHISNIRAFINGDEPLYILLDDNSMTDYLRGMQIIQQKACQANGYLGLDAIKRHMAKYPNFIEEGGIYQIPKDMYERYTWLRDLPIDVAMKLRSEDLTLWRYIRRFTENNPNVVIEPMEVSYPEIQAGSINNTVKKVEAQTNQEFKKQFDEARAEHAPTLKEFLKICGISAAIEGSVSAGIDFIQKLKNGKKISEFTKQDVKEVLGCFSIGCGKGAFRGGIIYIATNFIKTPASVASGLATAIMGIVHNWYLYLRKRISKKAFLNNSLFITIETAASVACAVVGKRLFKKHPVIGTIMGSILGSSGVNYIKQTAFA